MSWFLFQSLDAGHEAEEDGDMYAVVGPSPTVSYVRDVQVIFAS